MSPCRFMLLWFIVHTGHMHMHFCRRAIDSLKIQSFLTLPPCLHHDRHSTTISSHCPLSASLSPFLLYYFVHDFSPLLCLSAFFCTVKAELWLQTLGKTLRVNSGALLCVTVSLWSADNPVWHSGVGVHVMVQYRCAHLCTECGYLVYPCSAFQGVK